MIFVLPKSRTEKTGFSDHTCCAFSDDETDVGGRDVASPGPQTLLKRDSLQQRIRAKLDLSDWAITSAIKESFLGSPEPKNHRPVSWPTNHIIMLNAFVLVRS